MAHSQTKAWTDVAKANMKALTQHDSMGDWQDFRGGSKQQRTLAAAAGKSGPKMPKMGDRFLKRPSDSKVAMVVKGKRSQLDTKAITAVRSVSSDDASVLNAATKRDMGDGTSTDAG